MKAIRFGKLKNSTIEDIIALIPVDTNPNTKVYITTEKPLLQAILTIEQLESMLIVAKRNKLKEEAEILLESNPDLFEYIKELGLVEHYSTNDNDEY